MVRPLPGSALAALERAAATRFVELRAVLADFFPARDEEGRFREVDMTVTR